MGIMNASTKAFGRRVISPATSTSTSTSATVNRLILQVAASTTTSNATATANASSSSSSSSIGRFAPLVQQSYFHTSKHLYSQSQLHSHSHGRYLSSSASQSPARTTGCGCGSKSKSKSNSQSQSKKETRASSDASAPAPAPAAVVHVHKSSAPSNQMIQVTKTMNAATTTTATATEAPSSPFAAPLPTSESSTLSSSLSSKTDTETGIGTGTDTGSPKEIPLSDHHNNIIAVQTRDYEHSYLPGILLSKGGSNKGTNNTNSDMQQFYFALRAFHIEIASIRSNEKDNSRSSSNSLGGSGSNLALLRMRWWKEALHYIYDNDNDNDNDTDGENDSVNTKKKKKKAASSGNVGNNPTIRSVRHVVQSQGLSRHLFETMIDARMDDLARSDDDDNDNNNESDIGNHGGGGSGCGGGGGGVGRSNDNTDDLFQSTSVMVDFYSRTISSLLFLHLECCGVKLSFHDNEEEEKNGGTVVNTTNENDDRLKEVVNCIGIGIGIINSIRSINTGQTGIPKDLVRKYKINMNDINDPRPIIDGQNDDGKAAIQGAVREMALLAKEYLYHARLHQGVIPGGDARSSLLAVVSALRYLERLEKLDFDIFHESLRDVENVESLNGRLWRLGSMFYLWRAWLTGVF